MGVLKEDKPKSARPAKKWREGVSYVCTHSASPGYRKGEKYKCFKNDSGIMCLTGRDGYVDICSMLVSEFKEDKNEA